MLECPTINAVVGCVQPALWEPDDIASLESASPDGLERAIPVQRRMGLLEHGNTRISECRMM